MAWNLMCSNSHTVLILAIVGITINIGFLVVGVYYLQEFFIIFILP